jgi:hypothetical protein
MRLVAIPELWRECSPRQDAHVARDRGFSFVRKEPFDAPSGRARSLRQHLEEVLMATKAKGGRQYGKGASAKVEKAMHERKQGKLRSGASGKKVTSRKQAIAIGLSEARKEGKKVPKRPTQKPSKSS